MNNLSKEDIAEEDILFGVLIVYNTFTQLVLLQWTRKNMCVDVHLNK